MNVCFFQCQEDYNGNMYLPYSSGILWAYVQQFQDIKEKYNLIDIFFEKLPPKDYITKLTKGPVPDIVFFSNYGWNTAYHLAIAKRIKKEWPDIITVIGGPNAQQDKEYLEQHDYIDYSIWGEGEQTLLEFLRSFPEIDDIPGIAYYKAGYYFKSKQRSRQINLDLIPSPYLIGIFDSYFTQYKYNFMPVWETNRGCPYHCTFCDLGADYYNKLYEFGTERLLAEIDWFSRNKIEYVEIADANFGILNRDLDLVKYIKHCYETTGYPKKINATWAKNSPDRVFEMSYILDKMNRGGVTLALQSSNPVALDNIKRINIANSKLEKITKRYIDSDIQTYHDFILGLPGETLQSWKEGLLQIVDINPEGWIFGHPLEAYKNTEFQDPNYIKKHNLKFATTPQVSFFAKRRTDIPIEYGQYVVSHNTMSFLDYLEAFAFKWFIISMHSLGWARHTITELSELTKMPKSKLYLDLFYWSIDRPTLISNQYYDTKQSVYHTLKDGKFWGKQVFGSDDVYWEYESASSIAFEQNRERFYLELVDFAVEYVEQQQAEEIVIWNDIKQISWSRDYPYQFNGKVIHAKKYNSFQEFCINIYWYGRRQRAWRTIINDKS